MSNPLRLPFPSSSPQVESHARVVSYLKGPPHSYVPLRLSALKRSQKGFNPSMGLLFNDLGRCIRWSQKIYDVYILYRQVSYPLHLHPLLSF